MTCEQCGANAVGRFIVVASTPLSYPELYVNWHEEQYLCSSCAEEKDTSE